ncbi:MAG TPA: hypothetical protein VKB36_24350 [Vicinamibacterales bacterium]|nr:hypothetical protein [Vicinamibacterales bacterium]
MRRKLIAVAAIVCAFALPSLAGAQTDEIQVYDAELAPVGVFNLTWHNNYTPKGLASPAFQGAIIPDKSWNGVTEWAYGVTPWFEAGLYLPLYSHSTNLGGTYDGFKLRALFAVPHAADRTFFYGANFEFSINQKDWNEHRYSSEVRPIIGWHLKPWDIIINPIIDTDYDGWKNLDFAPAMRLAYNFSDKWALAAEEYADYGPVSSPFTTSNQSHMLYGVVNHTMKFLEIEAGVGFGLTSATDNVTIKLLLIKDLNSPH